MSRDCSVSEARALVHGGSEVAFLDIRELALYGEGHPLFAVPCPYSQLEIQAPRLIPNRTVPVLLVDHGDGLAAAAARRLELIGYTDIRWIDGGAPAWSAAGHTLHPGVNVPSKTLGELLEHELHPAAIDAATLARWREEGRNFRLFDARPPEEFGKMCIDGAVCMPNGELAHRFAAAVLDPDVPVVVTCAGRTRGLVGVVGLQLAGCPNPIYALENGTQGWSLAGYPLARGRSAALFPALDADARIASRDRARRIIAAEGLRVVDPATAGRLAAETDRSSFVFDLRTAEEIAGRPVAGATAVLGGQLVQATDQYVGVRHARIILIDDTGLRGAIAATFLSRLGLEPLLLPLDDHPDEDLILPVPEEPRITAPPAMAAADAITALRNGASLLDLRRSANHVVARPRGAVWSVRPRLAQDIPDGVAGPVLLLADEPAVAALAALDLGERGLGVAVLDGGLDAWRRAGGTVEEGGEPLSRDRAVDAVWFTHGRHDGDREASLRYLAWETGLIALLDPLERAEFRV